MSKKLIFRERDGELDLSMCKLQDVPVGDIVSFKRLTSLNLSNNRITHIGKNFAQLNYLVKLDLSKNQLKSLADNFGDLRLLRHLDLSCNQLNHLPLSFGQLRNLKWLNLKNNPLVRFLSAAAGPCEDNQQCQICAKRVVKAVKEANLKMKEEQKASQGISKNWSHANEEMAEKATGKREQQNNKKANKNQEKKSCNNRANGIKNVNEQQASSKQVNKNKEKKKEKSNKGNNKSVRKSVNKPSGQVLSSLLQLIFLSVVFGATFLGFFYIVDNDKYRLMREKGVNLLNSTVQLLPAEVLTKWQKVAEYARPTVEMTANKFHAFVNYTSTVLNTNPVLKEHWSNINEISSVIGERVAEYMRTVYRQIPIYYDNAKNKLF